MKKTFFYTMPLFFAISAHAHVTDELHWIVISQNNGSTLSVNQEGFEKRKKNGFWMKIEKEESFGISETYTHLKADCKKYSLIQDEKRLKTINLYGEDKERTSKNIIVWPENTYEERKAKQNIINLICD